jgi:pre-mRNA-processing factor 6
VTKFKTFFTHLYARAIYAHATSVYPKKKSLWLRMAELERQHGTREKLIAVLKAAVRNCPKKDILWLMYAKEQWLGGDINAALDTLIRAFTVY